MSKRERPPLVKAASSVVQLSAYRVPTENRLPCPFCSLREEPEASFARKLHREQRRKTRTLADLRQLCAEHRAHFERRCRALAYGRVDVDFAEIKAIRLELRCVSAAEQHLDGVAETLRAEVAGER